MPSGERFFLDQQALTFIALARSAPLQHDSGERRVTARATRQRNIAGGQEDEMVEVGAGQAESAALAGQRDPCMAVEHARALVAGRFTRGNKDLEILGLGHGVSPNSSVRV